MSITIILNEVVTAMLPGLNYAIPGQLKNAGLDPYPDLADGSKDIGIGTANYHIANLTGISTLVIDSFTFSNVAGDLNKATGDFVLNAHLASNITVQVSADLKLPGSDPSIAGTGTVTSVTVTGGGTFSASMHTPPPPPTTPPTPSQVCMDSVSITTLNVDYAAATLDLGAGFPGFGTIEAMILAALKSTLQNLINTKLLDALGGVISGVMPQCVSLPFVDAEAETAPSRARVDSHDSA